MMNRLKRAEKTDENRAFSNRKAGLLDEGNGMIRVGKSTEG